VVSTTAKSTEETMSCRRLINVQKIIRKRQKMILFRDGFSCSRWRNVDSNSADVTSAGRSFQIRGPTTGKARMAKADNMTASARRTKSSTARQVAIATRSSGPTVTVAHRGIAARVRAIFYARMASLN